MEDFEVQSRSHYRKQSWAEHPVSKSSQSAASKINIILEKLSTHRGLSKKECTESYGVDKPQVYAMSDANGCELYFIKNHEESPKTKRKKMA